MDYTDLALDFMKIMHQVKKRRTQEKINDSMHGEQFVLFYISKHEGSVMPSDISNEMEISSARIAAALNNLEGKGLITRRINEDDRRKIMVNLTDAGHEQVKQHYQMIMNITTHMLEYLGEDDSKELIRIMKKLADISPEDLYGQNKQ